MSDKLVQDVKAIVDEIFKQQEEATMRKETEEALTQSAEKINELTASLEAKDAEVAELMASIEELEKTIAELSDKVNELNEEKASFESEKEELIKRAEEAEKELESIKKDQLAKARFEELEAEKVAASTDDAKDAQLAKLREMTDEEFAAYKQERIELRDQLLAQLEQNKVDNDTDTASDGSDTVDDNIQTDTADVDTSDADFDDDKDADITDDMDTASYDSMRAVASLLNLNAVPNDDMLSKYKKLGEALAQRLNKNDK